VNAWVNDRTSGRIPTILDQIEDGDAMYLINAIYFKGRWRTAFDRGNTRDEAFINGHAMLETVPMMHLEQDGIVAGEWPDGTRMVELPYGNTAFAMRVYLPADTSTVEHLIGRLTLDRVNDIGSMTHVSLWMPRVKLDYERHLGPDLSALGMGVAFSDAADFSGMTTSQAGLKITDVLQKTFLSIDEDGTEAAAATKVTIGFTSVPASVAVRLDRPYLVVIRERLSGTILFIGKINTI